MTTSIEKSKEEQSVVCLQEENLRDFVVIGKNMIIGNSKWLFFDSRRVFDQIVPGHFLPVFRPCSFRLTFQKHLDKHRDQRHRCDLVNTITEMCFSVDETQIFFDVENTRNIADWLPFPHCEKCCDNPFWQPTSDPKIHSFSKEINGSAVTLDEYLQTAKWARSNLGHLKLPSLTRSQPKIDEKHLETQPQSKMDEKRVETKPGSKEACDSLETFILLGSKRKVGDSKWLVFQAPMYFFEKAAAGASKENPCPVPVFRPCTFKIKFQRHLNVVYHYQLANTIVEMSLYVDEKLQVSLQGDDAIDTFDVLPHFPYDWACEENPFWEATSNPRIQSFSRSIDAFVITNDEYLQAVTWLQSNCSM
jgi:hypothetical protein